MKIFYILFLVLIPFFSHAQEHLIGSWELNLEESLMRMREDKKVFYDTLILQVKERINQTFSNRKFTFEADNVVTIKWMDNNVVKQVQGRWGYNAALNTLIITANESQQREYEVIRLTSSVLILKMKDTGGIFHELYLERRF